MADTFYQIQWKDKEIWYNRGGSISTLERAQEELYLAWDFFHGERRCRILCKTVDIVQELPTKEEFYKKVGDLL